MNRIPFSLTVNALNIGKLKDFAHKWNGYSEHRKYTWMENFRPSYQSYLFGKMAAFNSRYRMLGF